MHQIFCINSDLCCDIFAIIQSSKEYIQKLDINPDLCEICISVNSALCDIGISMLARAAGPDRPAGGVLSGGTGRPPAGPGGVPPPGQAGMMRQKKAY